MIFPSVIYGFKMLQSLGKFAVRERLEEHGRTFFGEISTGKS
jgi:hypothetical protein